MRKVMINHVTFGVFSIVLLVSPAYSQIAIGQGTKFNDLNIHVDAGGIGLGSDDLVSNWNSIAIGKSSLANDQSIAIGNNSSANQSGNGNGVAVGSGAVNQSGSGFAGGAKSDSGQYGVAVGYQAVAGNSGTAIGAYSSAEEFDIALGYRSVIGEARIGDRSLFGGIAAGTHDHKLSIGTKSEQRVIQNVGPGVIAADSTDGVNGSQVYSLKIGFDNLGSNLVKTLGGTTSYDKGAGAIENFKLKVRGTAYEDVTSAFETTNKDIKAVVDGDAGVMQRKVDADIIVAVAAAGTSVKPGNAQRISNVAAGVTATDAVNLGQLREVIKSLDEKIEKYQSVRC